MPSAVTSTETKTVNLESVEGGVVELRRFSYGERLSMRSISSRMSMGSYDPKKSDEENAEAMAFSMDMEKLNFYRFSKAIVSHNLEDDKGRKLNFTNRADFNRLNESVGREIEAAIEQLNPDGNEEGLDEKDANGVPLDSESTKQ